MDVDMLPTSENSYMNPCLLGWNYHTSTIAMHNEG